MTFSVVICTYNRAEYLLKTLESAVLQSHPGSDFEVIVVDNNSTDNTPEILSFIQEKYSQKITLRYYKETQKGVSFARNLGVQEAKGEYIVFIDDDETVTPDFLNNLYSFLQSYPQAELISEPVVPVFETEKPDWFSPYTTSLITGAYDKGDKIKIVGKKDYPGTGHATFKRELFHIYGGFNIHLGRKGTSLMGGEDKDFFLRLINNGVPCYYVPTAIIYHHIPARKLTEEFFHNLTLSIGKSERIRTLNISRKAYYSRLFSELIKWGASFVLFFYYTFTRHYQKGKKLLQFRWNVSTGLLTG
ncbi:MAG: glycosyltransferase family 2 protein [Bacteroidales bacterium]|nr:glycosyltransferase family 2 protein [Bacteroidales bacterium]